jgi:hypothetical protein
VPYTNLPPLPAANSTDYYPYVAAVDKAIRELQAGGTPEQSVGSLNAADPKWGLTPWDPSNPVENDITDLAIAAHAQKKAILVPNIYRLSSTVATSHWNDRNMHLISVNGGGFMGEGGTILRQIIAPSPTVAVLDIATKSVGTEMKHGSSFIDVPAADLQKFCAEMVWQIVATGAVRSTTSGPTSGFYTWGLPGSVLHDLLSTGSTPNETGKPVMAEAFAVLGVTFLLSSSSTLTENDRLTGATSGATMKIESYGDDDNGSSNKRITARRTIGTFKVGENVTRGGTVVGKIASDGQVITKGATYYDWSKITVERSLRKLGGSQGGYESRPLFPAGDYFSNLISRTDGLTFDAATDPNATGIGRGAAIDIRGAVNGRYIGDVFKAGYRNGFRIASGFGGVIANSQALELPNDATTEGGYGYHVEVEGTTQNFVVIGCISHNVRHGFTTNPTGNTGFLIAVGDTLRHGIQRFVYVINHQTFNTYGPGLDTHHGASDIYFIGCNVTGIIAGGQKDSEQAAFQTRSFNTWYLHCTSRGGRYGFTDATAGVTVPQGNPNPNGSSWPLEPMHSRQNYLFCVALDYEEVGFRQALAAESQHHSALYVAPHFRAKKGARYPTVGMRLTGVDTWVIDPIMGENTLAMIDVTPGSYWKNGPTPTSTVKSTIGVIGSTLADYTLVEGTACDLIRVAGPATAGAMTLALPGDVDVVQKATAPGMPAAWVNPVSGRVTVKGAGKIRNLSGSAAIPLLKSGASGTVTRASIPTSSWA